jgi:UDP-glucose 4-epimerase
MRPSPESPYGITKLSGEYYCRMFAIQGRLCTACLRYFNVYGPRQDPASQYAAAIPHFIARALAGEPLTIFGDGLQTRDFVFVKDVVAANIHCALHEDLDSVYNVACGTRISVNQLAETIVRACGSGSEIRYAAERPGDVKHSVACVDRLAEAGFRARTPLVEGLGATVAYFRDLTSPARGC